MPLPSCTHMPQSCFADNPQMYNCSILPELQTYIQLPTGHSHLGVTHRYLKLMSKIGHAFLSSCSSSCLLSVTGTTKLDTWESSFILPPLLHPYIQSVPKDGCSLQTLTGSTLSPRLLTLPRFRHRSSPAPRQSLPGVWLPAFSSDPSSTQHWGKGAV